MVAPDMTSNDPLINRTIEGYQFIKRLGEGSFGLVYLARHPRIKERLVAIKYIKLGNPDEVKKVEREVDILARLQHPNVVNIYDTYRFDHYQLIVMELIRGGSLHHAMRQIPKLLDVKSVVEIVEQLAFALGYVHSQNILHLDLKPANILLDSIANGQDARLVLTDFGIAEIVSPGDLRSTNVVGTPVYMSPEHFGFGDNKPDYRSDIYSLGIILYELLVGHVPFKSLQMLELLNMHAYSPIPRVTDEVSSAPVELDEIIKRALAKQPEDRFQSANEMGSALRDLREGPLATWQKMPDRMAGSALGIIAQSGSNAMDSINEQYPPPEVKSLFNLMVIKPDGNMEAVGFNEHSIVVGRDASVDLQLEQKTISRRHAQIDCDRQGNLFITDLESANGTFLDGVRLTPRERIPWKRTQYLQIQGHLLQIEGLADQPGKEDEAFIFTTDRVMNLLDELQERRKKPSLRVQLSPDVVYLEPGKPQYVQVRVHPENTPLARYQLRARPGPGIDERWYTLPAGNVINSDDTYTFDLMVTAPLVGTHGGETYELALEVNADHPEIPSAIQILKVRVVQVTRFIVSLQPSEVSHNRRRRAQLFIVNAGNQSERFTLEIQSPDTLKITPDTTEVEVEPATEKIVKLQFKPARDARRARGRLIYSVAVHSASGIHERAAGSYTFPRKGRFPLSFLLLWVVVVIVAARQFIFGVPAGEQFEEIRLIVTAAIEYITGLGAR